MRGFVFRPMLKTVLSSRRSMLSRCRVIGRRFCRRVEKCRHQEDMCLTNDIEDLRGRKKSRQACPKPDQGASSKLNSCLSRATTTWCRDSQQKPWPGNRVVAKVHNTTRLTPPRLQSKQKVEFGKEK